MKFFEIDLDSVGSGACVYVDFKDGIQVSSCSTAEHQDKTTTGEYKSDNSNRINEQSGGFCTMSGNNGTSNN